MKIYKAKKSLGQNFLKSEPALRKIIEVGEIKKDDVILEIGPGKGILTAKLLTAIDPATSGQGKVIAVEKDRELFEFLKIKFEKEIAEKKLVLLNEDILEFEFKQAGRNISERTLGRSDDDGQRKFSAENFRGESGNVSPRFKIIANIPYNITGAILKKFLTADIQPESMVLMVQQEVAQRIVARDGKESILSISVKAYGEPKLIMKVPKRYFSPAPKVDSAIISIKNISRRNFTSPPPPSAPPPYKEGGKNEVQGRTLDSLEFEERFWELVKTGFAHKRKKLSGNLKKVADFTNPLFIKFKDKRAEDLSLADWIELSK